MIQVGELLFLISLQLFTQLIMPKGAANSVMAAGKTPAECRWSQASPDC